MSKDRIEVVTNLVKKVIEINILKGTKLSVSIDEGSLRIIDINNGCKSLLDGESFTSLYFNGTLGTYFEETLEKIYKALERY